MHDFIYISKRSPEVKEAYDGLMMLLSEVHQELKDKYTFQHKVVGSYARNMMTFDRKSNIGYDFDVNIYPHDYNEEIEPELLKRWFGSAIDKFAWKYGFDYAEDSTRVLTIKVKDRMRCRIVYSVDFCIVNDYEDNKGNARQQYIRFNKIQNKYIWAEQPKGYYKLPEKVEWIKKNGLWNDDFLELYIDKKNANNDPDVHSRTIFAITVQETCQQNGYYKK